MACVFAVFLTACWIRRRPNVRRLYFQGNGSNFFHSPPVQWLMSPKGQLRRGLRLCVSPISVTVHIPAKPYIYKMTFLSSQCSRAFWRKIPHRPRKKCKSYHDVDFPWDPPDGKQVPSHPWAVVVRGPHVVYLIIVAGISSFEDGEVGDLDLAALVDQDVPERWGWFYNLLQPFNPATMLGTTIITQNFGSKGKKFVGWLIHLKTFSFLLLCSPWGLGATLLQSSAAAREVDQWWWWWLLWLPGFLGKERSEGIILV